VGDSNQLSLLAGPLQLGRQIDRHWRGLLIHAKLQIFVENAWRTGINKKQRTRKSRMKQRRTNGF
jgi:hypothetical protein